MVNPADFETFIYTAATKDLVLFLMSNYFLMREINCTTCIQHVLLFHTNAQLTSMVGVVCIQDANVIKILQFKNRFIFSNFQVL
jgi:hypothetical protein